MSLTPLQRNVCRFPARERRAHGESYVAGGVALSVAIDTHRLSRDVDFFHDTIDEDPGFTPHCDADCPVLRNELHGFGDHPGTVQLHRLGDRPDQRGVQAEWLPDHPDRAPVRADYLGEHAGVSTFHD